MAKEDLSQYTDEELVEKGYHDVDMKKLTDICNPFKGCWIELNDKPITKKEVLKCIADGKAELIETPIWYSVALGKSELTPEEIRENHIKKIAYFASNEIKDPISIDVGIPDLRCYVDYVVDDGNHRLAGEIIKGSKTIKAKVMGSESHAKELGLWNPNQYELESFRRFMKEYKQRQKEAKNELKAATPKRMKP